MPPLRLQLSRTSWLSRTAALSGMLLLASGLGASQPGRPQDRMDGLRREAFTARFPGLPESAAQQLTRCETALALLRKGGGLQDPAWKARWALVQRTILSEAYLASLPGHPPMSESQLKQLYLAQGEQRRVSHILLPTEAEAQKALERLRAGASFQDLAASLSSDTGSAARGGDLGWIRKNQVVAGFGDPVFNATPGQVIGPFQTDFGWHLALVQEIRPQREADFPSARAALQKEVGDAQAALKRQQALEHLRTRYPLTRYPAVLGRDRGTTPAPGDGRRVAGRVAGHAITLAELKAFLAGVMRMAGQSHSLGAEVKGQFLEGMADDFRLEAAAHAAGLDRAPGVQASLWAARRTEAYQAFRDRYLASCKVPDADLEAHWRSHPDRFLGPSSLHLNVLVTDSESRATSAIEALHRGMAWEAAFHAYGDPASTGAWDPGWVAGGDLARMVPPEDLKRLLDGSLNQLVGPFRGPDGFVLIRAVDRKPGAPLSFEASRAEVLKNYLAVQGPGLVDAYLDRAARTARATP